MAVRVLIVDDSALIRRLLARILAADPEIEVVGSAPDPYAARELIKALDPDVVTLDVEMPRMDGLTFLRNLMRLRPTPVVMISSLTREGAQAGLDALHLGAVDCIGKPDHSRMDSFDEYAQEVVATVKAAAGANLAALVRRTVVQGPVATAGSPDRSARRVVAIGASTGGTEAIAAVLAAMPQSSPPIVIAQHLPEMFTRSFSERVDRLSPLCVREACNGEPMLPGHAYVAPGNHHLSVVKAGDGYACWIDQKPRVNRHRPSVDVLLHSVARCAGSVAIGVLLTGMGRDGALGLKAMRDAGAWTLAQDQASSVVWGMPGAAVEAEAVDRVVTLEQVAAEIVTRITL